MSGVVQVHVAVREDDPGKNPGASVEELRDQRSLEDRQARGAVRGVMPGREARACSPVCGIEVARGSLVLEDLPSPGGGAGRDARA